MNRLQPTKRICFETALKLWLSGITGVAEYSYRFGVTSQPPADHETDKPREVRIDGVLYREVRDPRGKGEYWDGNNNFVSLATTARQEADRSNRFTDSWDDAIAPAYTTLELAALLPENIQSGVTASTDPEVVALIVMSEWGKQ